MDLSKISKLECKEPPIKLLNLLDKIQKELDDGKIRFWYEFKISDKEMIE